jgi:predicted RNA-binding Zn ribbon-like protein
MTTTTQPLAHPVDHAHAVDLEACLDLINTLELDGTEGVPEDHIPTLDDVVGWVGARSIAHEDALRLQAGGDPDAWLARFRDLRDALREAWVATVEGRSADVAALGTLNGALHHRPMPELRPTLAGIGVGHRHDARDATGEAFARVTEPLVEAIASGDTDRFRICANDACRWVFEDTSRGGRRRWCDMQSCGNRAKVRRFRSRQRAEEVAGDAGSPAGHSHAGGGSAGA